MWAGGKTSTSCGRRGWTTKSEVTGSQTESSLGGLQAAEPGPGPAGLGTLCKIT